MHTKQTRAKHGVSWEATATREKRENMIKSSLLKRNPTNVNTQKLKKGYRELSRDRWMCQSRKLLLMREVTLKRQGWQRQEGKFKC